MCGIAGWCNWPLAEEDASLSLRAMCDVIRHRGPDDAGYFLSGNAALGMRRLAIVDLTGGHQPMTSADGRYTLVMNGEIFNHNTLRENMRNRGETFRTSSDTEVLLKLFETHGVKAFELCNGMFAAALWDAQEHSLLLIRDRMGVKPLYYFWDGEKLLFASEIKAILAAKSFEPEIAPEAIWHYLTFRYVPSSSCIWKHIHKLPPAHSLYFRTGMHAPSISRWWDIPYTERPLKTNEPLLDATFRGLMNDATTLRMCADVPVGILLSGGLDSSVVAALAQRHSEQPIKTFSVAFEDPQSFDERPFARLVAKHLGAEHHEVVVGQRDFMDFLSDLTWYTDEPLADLASIPLHYVCKLAAQHVKVVLSGEGSDEIFAGYNFEIWAERWAQSQRRNGIKHCLDFIFPLPQEDMQNWLEPLNMTNALNSQQKKSFFRDGIEFPDSFHPAREHLRRLGKQNPLHQALYLYCQDWLVEDLRMKADRMSMATSIELRTPFLDYRLVEWAASIPANQKAGRRADGSWGNKLILRRLAADLLPEKIIDRPKMGFPVPVYNWLSDSLRSFAHDLLGSRARISRWLEPKAIANTLVCGTSKDAPMPARHELWHLLILEIWMRTWKQ